MVRKNSDKRLCHSSLILDYITKNVGCSCLYILMNEKLQYLHNELCISTHKIQYALPFTCPSLIAKIVSLSGS